MFNRYIKHRTKREAVEETLPGAALHIIYHFIDLIHVRSQCSCSHIVLLAQVI